MNGDRETLSMKEKTTDFGRINAGRSLSRRTTLRGVGVSMALPYLTAMRPAHAATDDGPPRRFVAFTLGLGLLGEHLFPNTAGEAYETTPYLRPLEPVRGRYTVFSGISHPKVNGGHRAEASILTGTPMGSAGGVANTISVDQLMAKHHGHHTRFASLTLAAGGNGSSPSYTESGAMVPSENDPAAVFERLFVDGSADERRRAAEGLSRRRSLMDLVAEDSRSLRRQLGRTDRDRLDQYFGSVRELERRLELARRWSDTPKPDAGTDGVDRIRERGDFVGRFRVMADIVRLAMKTDSTRVATLHLPGSNVRLPHDDVTTGYHSLSHHGRDEDKLRQLKIVETELVQTWAAFVGELADSEEAGASLLDRTSVLLTSNLGNASNHNNRNLPVLLAGGGLRHGRHLAFDRKDNHPLSNLYVTLLQHSGLAVDRFPGSTGTMPDLV